MLPLPLRFEVNDEVRWWIGCQRDWLAAAQLRAAAGLLDYGNAATRRPRPVRALMRAGAVMMATAALRLLTDADRVSSRAAPEETFPIPDVREVSATVSGDNPPQREKQ